MKIEEAERLMREALRNERPVGTEGWGLVLQYFLDSAPVVLAELKRLRSTLETTNRGYSVLLGTLDGTLAQLTEVERQAGALKFERDELRSRVEGAGVDAQENES